MDDSPRSFGDFWPLYLRLHRNPLCRGLHFVGTAGGIAGLLLAVALSRPWWVAIGMAFAYGLAWLGHIMFEKNRPATFDHPFWSLAGDFLMFGLWIAGRLSPALAVAARSEVDNTSHISINR